MAKELELLGLKINPLTMKEAVNIITDKIRDNMYDCCPVYTPNAEILMQARDDEKFRGILNNSWLTLPDGAGLKLAARLLPEVGQLPERVAGCDLLQNILKISNEQELRIYFLGAKPGVAAEAAHRFQDKYSGVNIIGCHHGYLDKIDVDKLITDINYKRPDLLFVGMGAPRQEKFISYNREELQVKVAVSVGGSFDVIAGNVNRAPEVLQKLYLEWFYRLIQEPLRWKRMLKLPQFMGLVMIEAVKRNISRMN